MDFYAFAHQAQIASDAFYDAHDAQGVSRDIAGDGYGPPLFQVNQYVPRVVLQYKPASHVLAYLSRAARYYDSLFQKCGWTIQDFFDPGHAIGGYGFAHLMHFRRVASDYQDQE